MPYVMVPVPEELVTGVMDFVLKQLAKAAMEPWDDDSISEIYHAVDEPSRSLLSFVARATLADKELGEPDLAKLIQLTPREAMAIMREINTTAKEMSRPQIVEARMVTETLPNGRTREKRIIAMEPDVAEIVQAVEKADLMSDQPAAGDAAS